jgi:hypothetical protein
MESRKAPEVPVVQMVVPAVLRAMRVPAAKATAVPPAAIVP